MIGRYVPVLLSLAALCVASTYGVFQWRVCNLRMSLYRSQRQVDAKAGAAAAKRAQLKALDERLSRLRPLTEEIGPAVVSDILYLAQDRGVLSLRALAVKHELSREQRKPSGP